MGKYMKEYRKANKDKISIDATSSSEEHDRTHFQDYYASNLELSLCYLLTSVTTSPLRRAIGSLLHDPRPVTMWTLRKPILNLLHSPRPVIIWTLRRAILNLLHGPRSVNIPTWKNDEQTLLQDQKKVIQQIMIQFVLLKEKG